MYIISRSILLLQTIPPLSICNSCCTLIQQYWWNQELEDEEKKKNKNKNPQIFWPSGKQYLFIMQKSVALMLCEERLDELIPPVLALIKFSILCGCLCPRSWRWRSPQSFTAFGHSGLLFWGLRQEMWRHVSLGLEWCSSCKQMLRVLIMLCQRWVPSDWSTHVFFNKCVCVCVCVCVREREREREIHCFQKCGFPCMHPSCLSPRGCLLPQILAF